MKCKVNNYMVLIVNNNKDLVFRGFDISKKFFSNHDKAIGYMIEYSKKFKAAKEINIEKEMAYINCGEYFVQIHIIDCSKYIEIIGVES